MTSKSYPIAELLTKSETSHLGKLITQAHHLANLNQTFSQILTSELIPHCHVGCYDSGILTLFTDSAAWATQLRYQVPTLLSQLRTAPAWAALRSIQIKVQTSWHQFREAPIPEPVSPPAQLSAANVAQLQALADQLKMQPGYESLISSLERLAGQRR